MKNYLITLIFALVVAGGVTSCGNDDNNDTSGGGFDVAVPSFIKTTTLVPVRFSVECDKAAVLSFEVEGEALGVVSPTQEATFGVDYLYEGDYITTTWANGVATATFWYIPLGLGSHTVTFAAEYTVNGAQKYSSHRQTLTVADAPNGGFYPEVAEFMANTDLEVLFWDFRNNINKKQGCDILVRFGDINGETEPAKFEIGISTTPLVKYIFYKLQTDMWYDNVQDWRDSDTMIIRNITALKETNTIRLIFCDNFNRCKDVTVEFKKDGTMLSSTAGEYYLLERISSI